MGVTFAPPRLEHFGPLMMAGRRRRHPVVPERLAIYAAIAEQWRAFTAEVRSIPALPPFFGYGVGLRPAAGEVSFEYFCGVVVASRVAVHPSFDILELPAMTMAVFEHPDHVSHLAGTVKLIYDMVLPMAAIETADEPVAEYIERYSSSFNPATGFGGIEVLVPVKV